MTWQKVLYPIMWSQRMEVPQLHGSEELRFHVVCWSLNGWLPTRGTLTLTNQRLIYRPSLLRFWPRWVLPAVWLDVDLGAIAEADRRVGRARLLLGSLYPGFPTFRIRLASGEVYYFQLAAKGAYIETIRDAVTSGPRTSTA